MVDIVIISLYRSSRLMGCYRLLRQIALAGRTLARSNVE